MSESDPDPEPELEADPGVESDRDADMSAPAADTGSPLDLPDPELGRATIVFDDPDGEKESRNVDNEHIVYFQDHWQLKTGTDDQGNDVIRRIPRQRVHYVERSVEEFEDRIDALIGEAKQRLPF